MAVVRQGLAPEAHPAEQPLHEAVALTQLTQRLQRARRQQAEVAGIGRNRCLGQPPDHPVERLGCRPFEPAFAIAHQARAVHVVIALLPQRDELGNQFRRILAIGIEDHHRTVVDEIQPGGERRFLAEIPRESQHADAAVGSGQSLHDVPCRIGTAVVHIQHAAVDTFQSIEHRTQPWVQHRQGKRFIVGGDDDGQAWAVHAAIVASANHVHERSILAEVTTPAQLPRLPLDPCRAALDVGPGLGRVVTSR